MVIHRGLVGGVKVVGQHIEPIQILVQLGHIVALVDVLDARWHSHGQEQACPAGLLRLPLELGPQLLHELGVVVPIPGLAALAVRRVLPVEVDAIEVVLSQELQYVLDELLATVAAGHQRGEPGAGLVPAANGNHGLQLLVVRFESGELGIATYEDEEDASDRSVNGQQRQQEQEEEGDRKLQASEINSPEGRGVSGPLTLLDVLVLVEGLHLVVLGESAERVHQMCTQVGIDVLRIELGRARPVDTPVCVVADHATLAAGFCICN